MTKEELLARVAKIREDNPIDPAHFTALVMGKFGTGKTRLFKTCKFPCLIDMFDPNGYSVLSKEIAEGKIIVRKFMNENSQKPTEYMRWEKQWEEDIKTGFLNEFATYGIDSLTTWIEACTNEIAKRKGHEDGVPKITAYPIVFNMAKDMIKLTSTQACDFIVTAHLTPDKDEVTGEITEELETYPKLRSRIPILFSEKYVLLATSGAGGKTSYKLLTQPKGRFRASTQLGKDGLFLPEEEPNVKALLKKAGLPSEDKVWR